MKINVTIKEVDHENLVDLLSTALYGNDKFYSDYDRDWFIEHCKREDGDCIEDAMAKVLLAGGKIEISDRYAEGADDSYGTLSHKWDSENWCMDYDVTLQDVVNGLQKAADDGESERVYNLANDAGQLDMYDADVLLQYIVFGECIYG